MRKSIGRWAAASTALWLSCAAQAQGSLADAYAIIASKKFIDLTEAFSPTTPVWKGFGQATLSAASDPVTHQPYSIEKDGFRTTFYSMVGQYGTHIDPPAHFDLKGTTLDQIPLQEMILPLVVFDATPLLAKDPNHALNVADLHAWKKKPRPHTQRRVRSTTHGYVQGLDRQPRTFQALPVSRLVARGYPVLIRAAWCDGHWP